jgi:hypothetical protein
LTQAEHNGNERYNKAVKGEAAIYRFQKGDKLTTQERVEVSRQILNKAFPNVRFQLDWKNWQDAWHSTTHDFDDFTLDHLLEGEGAMAHGWGLYLQKSLLLNKQHYFDRFEGKRHDKYFDGRIINNYWKWHKEPVVNITINGSKYFNGWPVDMFLNNTVG